MEMNLASVGLLTLGLAVIVAMAHILYLGCAYIEYRFDIKKKSIDYGHQIRLVREAAREYKGLSEETIKAINRNLFEMDN